MRRLASLIRSGSFAASSSAITSAQFFSVFVDTEDALFADFSLRCRAAAKCNAAATRMDGANNEGMIHAITTLRLEWDLDSDCDVGCAAILGGSALRKSGITMRTMTMTVSTNVPTLE